MYTAERDECRKVFFESWYKYNNKLLLEPLEAKLIEIILLHPEYHPLLNDPKNIQFNDFVEHNPFLHMSLHLALHEQITTNRPNGIKQIYSTICSKLNDYHSAEHKMIDCLAQLLWDAQQMGRMPDESEYLQNLQKLT